MSDLVLNSLEIRNYRGLEELRIEQLGRVNLIVGKNNVGKTSVLEALRLYANPGSLEILFDLVETRDQFDPSSSLWNDRGRRYLLPFQRLFFMEGRKVFRSHPPTIIQVGEKGLPKDSLSISIEFLTEGQGFSESHNYYLTFRRAGRTIPLPMFWGHSSDSLRPRIELDHLTLFGHEDFIQSYFLSAAGLRHLQIESMWNSIALTAQEDDVLASMRMIAPDVERLVLKPIDVESKTRVPFVKLKGVDEPVSLRSLGDGMNRVFGIALALVNAKNGLLLIDEVENGLHYSVQPDLWRFLFKAASEMKVQIFATTHSFDCIKAFDVAARESDEEGILIRLAQRSGRTLVGEFDERELGIAVEGQIEVR